MIRLAISGAIALALLAGQAGPAMAQDNSGATAAKRRTQITIYPRHQRLSANAKRQCEADLVKEFRPSGTVIVPRMQCWWQ